MTEPCRAAFKEWSVICAALAAGRQSLILRKGGIDEGRDGFRVAHRRFWLFPTHYHQAAQSITADGVPYLAAAACAVAPAGRVRIELLAEVQQVLTISDADILPRLQGWHIWSAETIHQRFSYRQPGLFALLVRVYKSPEPAEVADEAHFAGCRSWLEFGDALSTTGLAPVLSDQAYAEHARGVISACRCDPSPS